MCNVFVTYNTFHIAIQQFLKQNLISSHRRNRLCNSLHLFGHSPFVTRDGVRAGQGDARRKERRKWKIEEEEERERENIE